MATPRLVAAMTLLAAPFAAEAQPARVHRVGVVHQGGAYSPTVNGLREGLRKLGLEEGKQVAFGVWRTPRRISRRWRPRRGASRRLR